MSTDDLEEPPQLQKKPEDNWKWQLQNRLTTKEQLQEFINLTEEEIKGFDTKFPVSVTPRILSLMHKNNPLCPIRRQFIPTKYENEIEENEMIDPCGEDKDSVTPLLVHRYPSKVLFLVSNTCSNYCRYCTRSRRTGKSNNSFKEKDFNDSIKYIKSYPNIKDILLSGGDPLLLSDSKLERIIKAIREIPHVEIIRIGTRAPIVLPSRITNKLCNMLEKYHPVFCSVHVNHPNELTDSVKIACNKLCKAGIPLGSQTVLLKNINDTEEILKELFCKLLRFRIKPYYLYQCDKVIGSSHFRTSLNKGMNLIKSLRGNVSWYAIPTFVVDAPGGGGKVPMEPNEYTCGDDGFIHFKNWQGKNYKY